MTEPDADAREIGFMSEADLAAGLPLRMLGIAMDLSEALPLPGGMHFDVEDGDSAGHLVPPALMADMTDRQREAFDAHTFGYDDATRAEVFRELYVGPRRDDPAPFDDADPRFLALRDVTRAGILRAYDLQPWHVGLAPAPPVSRWRRKVINPLIRAWLKITGRWWA